ncbi:hypothetical protein F441_06503 [Phytophthora nicotianae CJ01A1]|uniref:Uncharacterized protein n=5 Tax=Phytophthora nicotianae TaxID=4792 RepID=V9FH01_PHYNI|nr:hypothetical protein F443_06499 [Phytophthora nicotianae P1569]ETK89145.1 hypothetical protein L915_06703 [Phytophthora nicotianae]ETP19473.1 hypothetical protein F441_06503 [Phytophthora nicotianae CJ01A1]ETP47409.1 hypothetical protein F442_06542 [Phytophthora nicotianae P10297]ETL46048.1 hypothetical protein L916_03996 [Phytophthora nicotianae]
MVEADEIGEQEEEPNKQLFLPPPFHPITKAPNIALPWEGYDSTFVWVVWAVLDRANYERPNETYL